MTVLHISLFGTVRISHSNPALSAGKSTHTIQALLAYLALERNRLHPREVLADLFWGDYDTIRARGCLNTALWRLRQVLEPEGIPGGTYLLTNDHGDVGFNRESQHWLDVEVFEESLRPFRNLPPHTISESQAKDIENTLGLYSGDLLEGFYDEWALREREQLRRLYLTSLSYLMHYYKYHQDYERGLACGQKILQQDPLREEIHREMMRMYAESGQRSLVARQYEACRDALASELGVPPMEETQLLFQQLLFDSSAAAIPPSRDLPPAEIQSSISALRQAAQTLASAQRDLQLAMRQLEMLAQERS